VLSGPVTTLLAPLFFVRAIVSRKRDDITQALIVCIGGLGQIAVAILSSMNDRKVTPNPLAEGAIVFNKNFVELFLTRIAGKAVFLFEDRVLHESTLCFVLFWIILILALIALFQIAGRQRSAFWMLIVAFWLSILETSMALNGGIKLLPTTAGERYAFTPNYLILLALVIGATQMAVTPRRKAARILLGLCLVSGAVEFTMFAFRYKADWQSEPWRQQVLRWERDPSTRLQTMPILWPTYTLPPRQ
jgi:hypothetical protein